MQTGGRRVGDGGKNSINKRRQGQGVSALLKFKMVMFQEGDTGPGRETGREEMLSVEVGIKGDEEDHPIRDHLNAKG